MKGILLVNKKIGKTSFSIISILRKITNIKKIGHSGTLDPFATGLMVLLIGKDYTKKASFFQSYNKKYYAKIHLGKISSTLDIKGDISHFSEKIPSKKNVLDVLKNFQGKITQIPPMFSAKKIKGQKLYILARKGIQIQRNPILVNVKTTFLRYSYPFLYLKIDCSSGTYIRTIADDIGKALACGAYLQKLSRVTIGPFSLKNSIKQEDLSKENLKKYLLTYSSLKETWL